MPFKPLNEQEKQRYEKMIAEIEKEISFKQQAIADFKEKIEKGNWVSDIDWSKEKKSG